MGSIHRWILLFLLTASWRREYFVVAEAPLTQIPYNLYHSSDDLLSEIRALVDRHSVELTMEVIKDSDPGYEAEIAVITYNRYKRDLQNSTLRILLSFGQHGRELITSEVSMRLLQILSEEVKVHGADPISPSRVLDDMIIKVQLTPPLKLVLQDFGYPACCSVDAVLLQSLLSSAYPPSAPQKIVPMENVNGRKLVESGELCERRNGRGVDLNRNWSVDWGKKEKDYDPYEENPGSGPFSEPEARIMQKVAHSFRPHVWVNVHSGMEGLFMPYDHKKSTPRGSTLQAMMKIIEEVNLHHCHSRCVVGSGGGSVGYLAHGTSTDYMYDILKVPLAFTFEIYGDLEAPSKDCFKMFNPVDPETFMRVVDDWAAAFVWILEAAGRRNADVESLRLAGELGLGLQEVKTYFGLFFLSTALLLLLFFRRILRRNRSRQINLSLSV